jgi:hypothetical protein
MNPTLPENLSVIQAIQLILAPGVMINACGLLLLGINNKFTSVLNRIRALTEEKRKILHSGTSREFYPAESQRIESIARQVTGLLHRAQLIRNTIFCYLTAIGLFVITSLLIGADFFLPVLKLQFFIISAFLGGMVVVFVGVIFGVRDTLKGFKIVQFEVMVDE